MFVTTLVPAILAMAGGSLAASASKSVFESLKAPQEGWYEDRGSFTKRDSQIQLKIQLVHQNMDQFYERALNIATPGHELYGKFMTTEEIDDMIAPSKQSEDLVMDWLRSEGLGNVTSLNWRGNVVLVNTTIDKAEQLLNAEYKSYTDAETGNKAIRTLEYSVPNNLLDHIKTVQPTNLFGWRRYGLKKHVPTNETTDSSLVTGCSGSTVNPKCLANLYSFAGITIPTGGKMGIGGFIGQYASKSDLATFLKSYAFTGNAASSFTCASVDSGKCTGTAGDEADLDVEYARALIGTIPMDFYSVAGEQSNIFELLGDYLLQQTAANLPNVVSISYGGNEAGTGASVITATCDVFAQLGAKGVTTLIATGDSGVGSGCTTAYVPDFPAVCPYVTAVGGLQGTTSASGERGWTDGGGGFSNTFTQPTWQATEVNKWLTTNKDGKTSYYNSKGRAYPDVSAAAVGFPIVVGGRTEEVDGTSCATPTFASVVQLINSERIASGKSALGFLNPLLYSNPTALSDITTGGNGGCTRLGGGFTAIAGWDPATGLGAPNYKLLLAAANSNST